MQSPPLTILAFHGFGQNADTIERFVKPLARKAKIPYKCFNGSHLLPPKPEQKETDHSYSNYMYSNVQHTEIMSDDWASKHPEPEWKLEIELQDYMNEVMQKGKGNVVLFGFSEGGMLAAQIAHSFPERVKLVIIASSPFPPNVWEGKSDVPALIISSPQDQVVKDTETRTWSSMFSTVEYLEHDKGHKIHLPAMVKNKIKLL